MIAYVLIMYMSTFANILQHDQYSQYLWIYRWVTKCESQKTFGDILRFFEAFSRHFQTQNHQVMSGADLDGDTLKASNGSNGSKARGKRREQCPQLVRWCVSDWLRRTPLSRNWILPQQKWHTDKVGNHSNKHGYQNGMNVYECRIFNLLDLRDWLSDVVAEGILIRLHLTQAQSQGMFCYCASVQGHWTGQWRISTCKPLSHCWRFAISRIILTAS